MLAVSKYSEEQRTHGGKQMRAGLRSIINGKTGLKVFGTKAPMVPQAKRIGALRRQVALWIRQHQPFPRPSRAATQEWPDDISESSDLEDDAQERLPPDYDDDAAVMERYRNGIDPPSKRKRDQQTDFFAPSNPRKSRRARRTPEEQMRLKRSRDEDAAPGNGRSTKRARRLSSLSAMKAEPKVGKMEAPRPARARRSAHSDKPTAASGPTMAERMKGKRPMTPDIATKQRPKAKLKRTSPRRDLVRKVH